MLTFSPPWGPSGGATFGMGSPSRPAWSDATSADAMLSAGHQPLLSRLLFKRQTAVQSTTNVYSADGIQGCLSADTNACYSCLPLLPQTGQTGTHTLRTLHS